MGKRNLRLKKALEENKVSQKKLADALGISDAAVNERLNKDLDVDSIAFIDAVSDLTRTSKEYLIYGTEEVAGVQDPSSNYKINQSVDLKDEVIKLYRENADQQRQIVAMKSIEKNYEEQIVLLKDQVKKLEVELEKYRSLKTRT